MRTDWTKAITALAFAIAAGATTAAQTRTAAPVGALPRPAARRAEAPK